MIVTIHPGGRGRPRIHKGVFDVTYRKYPDYERITWSRKTSLGSTIHHVMTFPLSAGVKIDIHNDEAV